jgi:hypothetical protein
MDPVIFTGLIPLEEFKEDRPEEYRELVERGELDKKIVKATISPQKMLTVRIFGYSFLIIGISMIILIILSMLFGYQ